MFVEGYRSGYWNFVEIVVPDLSLLVKFNELFTIRTNCLAVEYT